MTTKLVRLVLDPTLSPGAYRLGDTRIVDAGDDAALGRELRTVQVACSSDVDRRAMAAIVAADEGLELTD